jgi:hypothetical protein
MSGVIDVLSPLFEVSTDVEPVAGCEVGEPDASTPLRGEFADDTGDPDSGSWFGPAGSGRNEPNCAGTLAESVAPADGDVAVDESVDDESVDDESVDDESVDDESDADPASSAHATPAPST